MKLFMKLVKWTQLIIGCSAMAISLEYFGEIVFLGIDHLTMVDWRIFFASIMIGVVSCFSQILYELSYFKDREIEG